MNECPNEDAEKVLESLEKGGHMGPVDTAHHVISAGYPHRRILRAVRAPTSSVIFQSQVIFKPRSFGEEQMGKITVCSNVHGVSWGCVILAVFLSPEMELYLLGICEWKQGRGSRWRDGGGCCHWFLICGLYHSRGHLQSIMWNFHELSIYLEPHAINIGLREGI